MNSSPSIALPPPAATRPGDSWQITTEGRYWRLVDLDETGLATATNLLDGSEAERAARFRFQRDRNRYVAAHAVLRLALAELLGQSPERIELRRGPHGKPGLPPEQGWAFNLSHSENIAVIAAAPLSRVAEIGVDVECVRPVADWQSLAREHFSAEEYRSLAATPDIQRSRAFLRCWTRKEACVKAIGAGLTIPTRDFSAGILANPVTISIEANHTRQTVEVHSLFEHETCIATVAWCPAARPSPS